MNDVPMSADELRAIADRLYDASRVPQGAGRPPGSLSLLAAGLGVDRRTVSAWADENHPNSPHSAIAALLRAADSVADMLDMSVRPRRERIVDRMADLIAAARKRGGRTLQ
jgi:hypothetical protein